MNVFKADDGRRIDIPGVPEAVRRPVDIDQSMTGFTSLRTLRIYQFDQGSVIEGHAEEDEVFVIVLAGLVEFTTIADGSLELASPVLLSGSYDQGGEACAAYLPRHASYKLAAQTDADVAYVRATPVADRLPKVFYSANSMRLDGHTVLLEEMSHAERLSVRLIQVELQDDQAWLVPVVATEAEALMFVKTTPEANGLAATCQDKRSGHEPGLLDLDSWDTVAVGPGDSLTLRVTRGSKALILVVMAS